MHCAYWILLLALCAECLAQGQIPHSLGLDELFSRIQGRLFSSKCEGENRQHLSTWSSCVWPRGDLTKIIKNFIADAKQQGCKTPPARLIRVGIESLQNKTLNEYETHPLYKNIPDGECGFCGRKARCCRNSQSFLTQSFEGMRCSNDNTACTIRAMDEEMRAELAQWYPDVIPPQDPCNFKLYLDKELDILKDSKAFKFAKPLMCQVIGSTNPTLECVSEGGECKCCCHGYRYFSGQGCVPLPGYIDQGECKRPPRSNQ